MNALLLSLLTLPAALQGPVLPGHAPRAERGEQPLVALEVAPGIHDLHLLAPDLGSATLVQAGVEFLPLQLMGARTIDALRTDRPREAKEAGVPTWIRLPDGGQLLRASQGSRVGILHVPPSGAPRWAVAFDNASQASDLLPEVAVSLDGRWLACLTDANLGGDVLLVDLLRRTDPINATSNVPPLQPEAASLRVGRAGVWFLAGGELWLATGTGPATPQTLPLLAGETLVADLVPSDEGAHVAVVTETTPTARRVLVASAAGEVFAVTGNPQPIELPGTQEPLGPFMSLSPDGSRLAWLTDGPPHELHVSQVQDTLLETHITRLPEFPIYIDNIGIIGFASPTQVCYLAGDVILSTVDEDDLIGASDMYATVTTTDGAPTTWNLTRTSGLVWPPFTIPATLSVSDAFLDPLGDRFLLVNEWDETSELLSFPIYTGGYYHSSSNMDMLLPNLEEDPQLHAAGRTVLVVSEEDGATEAKVHRLDPTLGQSQVATPVASFPLGTELRSVQGHRGFVAFVVQGTSEELWLSTPRGTNTSWLPASFVGTVSSTTSLLSGCRIVLGLSPTVGGDLPAVLDPSGTVTPLPLQQLPCRVLR